MLTSPTRLLAAALATQRLTRLITEDVITEPLRDRIFRRYGDPSTPRARYTPSFAITCPHCASLYAAFFIALLTIFPNRFTDAILTALAAAAAVSIYHDTLAELPQQKSAAGGWAT